MVAIANRTYKAIPCQKSFMQNGKDKDLLLLVVKIKSKISKEIWGFGAPNTPTPIFFLI